MKLSSQYTRPGRFLSWMQKAGFLNRYNLFWSFYEPRNFGDWIGPYLFEAWAGSSPLFYRPNTGGRSCGIFSAGSILRHIRRDATAVVWGSGIISSNDTFAEPLSVHAVRGPRSRDHLHRLGYQTTEVFGDPGILLPTVFSPTIEKSHRIGIIPHFVDYEDVRSAYESASGEIRVIDVSQSVEKVIEDILSCEMTVSSSLHGIIVSHCYGIKCAWVDSWKSLMGDGVKFFDYFEAGGIRDARPQHLSADMSVANICAIASAAPFPDLHPLVEPLKSACPFKSR